MKLALLCLSLILSTLGNAKEFKKYPFLKVGKSNEDTRFKSLAKFSTGDCSGVHIRKNIILTAAHCVFDEKLKQIVWTGFYPGINSTTLLFKKFVDSKRVYIDPIYRKTLDRRYDFALVVTDAEGDEDISIVNLSKGLIDDKEDILIAGYRGSKGSSRIYSSSCPVQNYEDDLLLYECSTEGGMSGSPIYFENELIGIHTGVSQFKNGLLKNEGILLNSERREIITNWLEMENTK